MLGTLKAMENLNFETLSTNKKERQTKMNSLIRWHRPDLANWLGVGRLTNLRDEIDRLFEAPVGELARTSQLLSGWTPLVDVSEDKDNVYVRAELPGMKKEDVNVTANEKSVVISVDAEGRKYYKELDLPSTVDPQRAHSSYNNGVLEVTLPLKSSGGSGVRLKVD